MNAAITAATPISDEGHSANSSDKTTMDSVRQHADDSGYSTSEEGNSTSGADDTSSGDPCSSSYTGDTTSSDEDDSALDVGERIDFICKKKKVLERASGLLRSEEHNYDASLALKSSRKHGGRVPSSGGSPPGSIWREAKDVLKQMSQKQGELYLPPSKAQRQAGRKRSKPSPADPAIDVSHVRNMSSELFASKNTTIHVGLPSILSSSTFPRGQWMAQALVSSGFHGSPTNTSQDYNWKVVSDPLTCSFGLLPPSSASMQNAVDIQDAIAVTDEPRLVTQCSPPFLIVHVNKAFCLFASLGAKETLIGRPVETIVKVSRPLDPYSSLPANCTLHGFIALPSNAKATTPCRFRAIPVLDRTRRLRIARTSPRSCMSHILIEVQDAAATSSERFVPLLPSESSKTTIFSSGNVLGAVG